MNQETALAPSEDRIASVDVLRGFALLGVLMVNLRDYAGMKSMNPVVAWLLWGKSVSIFSMLFGAGLALQAEKAIAAGKRFFPFAARRQTALFLIGVMHVSILQWHGDILWAYAIAGLITAALFGFSSRVLLVGALVAVGIDTCVNCRVISLPHCLDPEALRVAAEPLRTAAEAAVTQARWLPHSIATTRWWAVYWVPLQVGMTGWGVSLFLLGAWVWCTDVFRQPRRHWQTLRVIAVVGIAIGLVSGWAMANPAKLHLDPERRVTYLIYSVLSMMNVVMAMGYAAAFLLAWEHPIWRRVLDKLAPLGRMGLTTYLTHSLVCGAVFYHWGWGRFGQWGWGRVGLLGLGLYTVQALLSTWWLRCFRFGPAEWLWRSMTYARLQPMRRSPAHVDP